MTKVQKYLILGVPLLFLFGALFHFIYDLTNQNIIIGFISPVNESIWEHTKMVLVPLIIYYLIYYFKNKENLDKNNWFYALLISLVVSILSIPLLYYFYAEGLGIHSLVLDITNLFISLLIGQLIAAHIYEYKKNNVNYIISIIFIFSIFIIYMTFTLYPPKLPIFYDKNDQIYGINTD